MNNRPKVGVAVIIKRKDGKVLMGKRKGAHGEGCWQFPGGHLEYKEGIFECARREVEEEVGIAVKNLRHAAFTNDIFDKEGKHYITLFIVADYHYGEPENLEPDKCEGWDWYDWDKLPHPLFLPFENLLKQRFRP